MPQVILDTFTEGPNNTLITHVPDVGTSWAEVENTSATFLEMLQTADQVHPDAVGANGTRIIAIVDPGPGVVSCTVEATLGNSPPGSSFATCGFGLIIGYTDNNNYYIAGVFPGASGADKKIYKKVAGVTTELASGDNGTLNGDIITFSRIGTQLILAHNGSTLLNVTDGSLVSAGKCGMAFGTILGGNGGPHDSWRITLFEVTTPTNVATIQRRRSGARWNQLLGMP